MCVTPSKNLNNRVLTVAPGADVPSACYGFGLTASTMVIRFSQIKNQNLGVKAIFAFSKPVETFSVSIFFRQSEHTISGKNADHLRDLPEL